VNGFVPRTGIVTSAMPSTSNVASVAVARKTAARRSVLPQYSKWSVARSPNGTIEETSGSGTPKVLGAD